MSTQNQQNWNHNFMSFLAQDIYFTRLLAFKKHLSKYILNHHEKYQKIYISYFYKTLHFMRKLTKLESLKSDLCSSRYWIYKILTKSGKRLKRKRPNPNVCYAYTAYCTRGGWRLGPWVFLTPHVIRTEAGVVLWPAVVRRRWTFRWSDHYQRTPLVETHLPS